MTDTRRLGRERTLLVAGVLLAGLAGSIGFVVTCGVVHETEFSPRTFGHRSVRYHRVPFVELQVSPADTQVWTTPLADHLRAEGYLGPVLPGEDPQWTLVKGFAWEVRGMSGPAKSLCKELGCWQGEDETWIAWSKAHPQLGSEVWPLVVAAARSGEYEQARTILWAAKQSVTPPEFHDLRRFMAERR